MSYVTPPDIVGIPRYIDMPRPKLPNTSSWAWFCCACSQANQHPKETENYSVCKACHHERCRRCRIRWTGRTIGEENSKRARDHTFVFADGKYSPKAYDRLNEEDEHEAAKYGLETAWGQLARERREKAELCALTERVVLEEEAAARAKRGASSLSDRCIGLESSRRLGTSDGIRTGGGLDSRESGSSEESVKGDVGDVGRMVEKLVI